MQRIQTGKQLAQCSSLSLPSFLGRAEAGGLFLSQGQK